MSASLDQMSASLDQMSASLDQLPVKPRPTKSQRTNARSQENASTEMRSR
jgi:hypothetical protein